MFQARVVYSAPGETERKEEYFPTWEAAQAYQKALFASWVAQKLRGDIYLAVEEGSWG